MTLSITNTLTRQEEPLSFDKAQPIKLYVCGITPYDHAHIGHGRVYVTFDLLVRLLRFRGYTVDYIRNITDVEDKLINKAAEQGDATKFIAIANHFYELFAQSMTKLNCLPPSSEPRVTECIDEIITFIAGLIESNNAYQSGTDVYFDIEKFPDYGKLSRRDSKALQAGARVDINEKKRNPGDFALWKGGNTKVFWDSPWGKGRPGWHIECSVMAKKHLGVTIDIHGGGMDLIFPHHENELAQSEALHTAPFSRYWIHNAFVNINKEKMSKSLGNFVTLKDMFEKKDPMVVRFYYLQHQYRNPIDFSFEDLDATETAYKKIIAHYGDAQPPASLTEPQDPVILAMLNALETDLNTPKFLGLVFEHLNRAKQDATFASAVHFLLSTILGLTLKPLQEATQKPLTQEIVELLAQREEARKNKNWALADTLRDQLIALGHTIQDKRL
jgi:cysteinyl-tRNA synthetase